MGAIGSVVTIKKERSGGWRSSDKFSVRAGTKTWHQKDNARDIFLDLVGWALLACGAYWAIKAIIGFIKYYAHFAE